MKKIQKKLCLTALLMACAAQSSAAVNAPTVGEVERIIVDNPTDTWSGGTIVVSGRNIIIPRNMVIELPANRLTLQQLFTNAPSACQSVDVNLDGIPDETGLAKGDSCNASGTGAAADILANKTNAGNIIAGFVFLEKAGELVSGVVNFVNYDEGYFRVNGIAGDDTTGAMVRVNDPEGRHTHQVGASCAGSVSNCSADTRYTNDPDNYTFTGSTGYPMCIPSTVARGPFDFDTNRDGVIGAGEAGLIAQAAANGTGDILCPLSNRPGVGGIVADSRLFAPVQVGDSVNAEGNFETIGGVTFLSAHTVGVNDGLTTDTALVGGVSFQPDYIVFDEVGWDIPGYQNQRVRDLLIGFATDSTPEVDIFALYGDPDTNSFQELVFATTVGCDAIAGVGTCTTQGIVGNASIFKIVHDVDFIEAALGNLPGDRQSPCQHLNGAYGAGGIPDANGTLITTDPLGRCSLPLTIAKEFEVLAPATRDLIGRSRHKHTLHPSVVTLDFHGLPSQNGEYLNPVGYGHPEFVEINLNALQTPFIFAGVQENMDRRLGPGGCDGACQPVTGVGGIAIGDPSMRLDPFPYSDLDPGTQADNPGPPASGVPVVVGYADQKGRPLAYWPLTPGIDVMPWPPADPAAIAISPTDHVNLLFCTAP